MAYATLQDLLDEYDRPEMPELTQLFPAAGGGPDGVAIAQALEEAAGLMDEYIGARYALPLASLADARAGWLRRVNMEVARFLLWKDRASAEVRQRYEDHLSYLRDLARGLISWPDVSPPSVSAAGSADYSAPSPLFSRATLEDY